MAKKLVYFYGGGKSMTDGDRSMREILGGKGANLAEMANAGIPVPAGFTISTEACADFEKTQKLTKALLDEVKNELKKLEKLEGKKLGDKTNPLLVSVSLWCSPIDARNDGHRFEPWDERQIRSRLHQEDRQPSCWLGLLPTFRRHVSATL